MPRRIRHGNTLVNGAWHPGSGDNTRVVAEPPGGPIAPLGLGDFVFSYASVADDMPAWGSSIAGRDMALRAFYPTEPVTASALYSMASKYSAFEWELQGPPHTVGIYQRMLNSVQFGEGWTGLWLRMLTDLFSCDNGAHMELVRMQDDPLSPVVTLNHLDSGRCVRTGHKDTPVVYYDLQGKGHLMKWYQVLSVCEFPSPIERLRGIQLCAVSRLLRAAQIMRDISIYKREKVSGRFNRAIYFVSGVQQKTIRDMLNEQQLDADTQGLTRMLQPLIVASLDPTATVKVDSVQFATLPDNFDEDTSMRWYISQLALAFGGDYQDFAPLPGGNLGSSQQSRMLHQKGLGKGSRLFIKMIEQIMNFRGILPTNIRFTYNETDPSEDQQRTDMKLSRAKERQIRIMSGEVTPAIARQIAVDDGDLEVGYLMKMNEKPTSDIIALPAYDPLESSPEQLEIDNPDMYEGSPESQVVPGAQSWGSPASGGNNQHTTASGAGSGASGSKPVRSAPTQPKPKAAASTRPT